jgi:hypothetical protein
MRVCMGGPHKRHSPHLSCEGVSEAIKTQSYLSSGASRILYSLRTITHCSRPLALIKRRISALFRATFPYEAFDICIQEITSRSAEEIYLTELQYL